MQIWISIARAVQSRSLISPPPERRLYPAEANENDLAIVPAWPGPAPRAQMSGLSRTQLNYISPPSNLSASYTCPIMNPSLGAASNSKRRLRRRGISINFSVSSRPCPAAVATLDPSPSLYNAITNGRPWRRSDQTTCCSSGTSSYGSQSGSRRSYCRKRGRTP